MTYQGSFHKFLLVWSLYTRLFSVRVHPKVYPALNLVITFLESDIYSRGGSRALTGRVHFWKNLWEMQNFCHFYSQFSLFWSFIVLKIALRTGALHPLLDFSRCKCTRCTCGGTAPEFQIWRIKPLQDEWTCFKDCKNVLVFFFKS